MFNFRLITVKPYCIINTKGNTVGSLSKVQEQIVLGSILGDGYLRRKLNAHLEITHSVKQKEYVDWKYLFLKDIVITPPKTYKGNKGRVGYRFYTKSMPELTILYSKFYRNGKKIIPKGINLSPLSLAVWYMDDGSKSRNAGYLNCQQFDSESQSNLLCILEDFGIKAKLHKDKIYKRIYISSLDMLILTNLIKQFIVPSMRYKLLI